MELRTATVRKLIELLNAIRETQLTELDSEMETREFNALWREAELSRLLSSWNMFARYEGEVTVTKIRKLLKGRYPPSQFSIQTISKSPKIIHLVIYDKKWKSNQDKFLTSKYERNEGYFLPKFRVLLTPDIGLFTIANEICSKVEPVRFRALLLEKVYSETLVINKIAIKAVHEITGFHGLTQISYEGDHVKAGLRGLHQRQDIRVQTDQIGPRIAVSTPEFDLKVGPLIRIKKLEGFEQILRFL